MPKTVFFDVDGTLVNTKTGTIPQSALLAIRKLKDRGYRLGIASGRDKSGLKEISGLDTQMFDGFVLSNGAAVFEQNFVCIYRHTFPDTEILKVLEFSEKNNVGLIFETAEERFAATDVNEYMKLSMEYYHESQAAPKSWKNKEIVKINAFQREGFDFSELRKEIDICIVPCPGYCYDIVPGGVSKSSGIQILMDRWGLEAGNYICFGDHDNDREMIENAKIGVAVKDKYGSVQLQQIAKYTCEAAEKDGIYRFLLEMALIDEEGEMML